MTTGTLQLVAQGNERESTGERVDEIGSSLVARAQAGDRRAFDRLMREHEARVFGLARNLLGPSRRAPAEVADVAQQAFLRLYRHLGRLDPELSPWPYLCRIVVNLCRDAQRRSSRLRSVPFEELEQDAAAAPDVSPRQHALAAERRRELRRCLLRLSERERQAIVLRDIEGFSTREVADMLGSSPTTVRSQISRARLRLRAMLARDGERGEP